MSIYFDLEKIKTIAKAYSLKHAVRYHVIILNPNEAGEFDFGAGSTYEFVTDSYFEKSRPNVKLITNTDEY